jgi:hypothetical protein
VITTPQTITPTIAVFGMLFSQQTTADQWPDRRGDGHDESVGERFRHLDPLRDEQRDHPAREA